jgi:hypothetical protein
MDAAFTRCYSLHGLDLIVQCEDKELSDESGLLFAFLPFKESEKSDNNLPVSIKFVRLEKPAPIPRDSSKPYIVNDISIFDTSSSVIITDGYSTFCIDPWTRSGIVSMHPSFKTKAIASKYNFFLIGLTYLFSYQGLFDLHGAALSNHGTGYLFLGESHSGKSSIALNLVRLGWHYASDDSLLLKSNGNGVEVLSFRKVFYIDPSLASKYPEFDILVSNKDSAAGSKLFFDLEIVYPNQFQVSIVPKVLIFNKIVTDQKSTLQSQSKGQALANLLKQSISIFFNRQAVTQHSQILKTLINQCSCYQLFAGRDLYDEPDKILKILPSNQFLST